MGHGTLPRLTLPRPTFRARGDARGTIVSRLVARRSLVRINIWRHLAIRSDGMEGHEPAASDDIRTAVNGWPWAAGRWGGGRCGLAFGRLPFVTFTMDGNRIGLWNPNMPAAPDTTIEVAPLTGPLAISPDGRCLAAVSGGVVNFFRIGEGPHSPLTPSVCGERRCRLRVHSAGFTLSASLNPPHRRPLQPPVAAHSRPHYLAHHRLARQHRRLGQVAVGRLRDQFERTSLRRLMRPVSRW